MHKTGSNLDYLTQIHQTFVRNKIDTSLYAFLYRVHLSPQQWGNSLVGRNVSKGYIRSKVILRSNEYGLLSWAPNAEPQVINGSVGFGLDSEGKASFSISVNYQINDLDIIASSNVGARKYETEYKFNRPHNHYSRTDSTHYGGFIFEYNPDYSSCGSNYSCYSYKSFAYIDINHEIQYVTSGVGLFTNSSAWKVTFTGYSRTESYSKTY